MADIKITNDNNERFEFTLYKVDLAFVQVLVQMLHNG